MGYDCLTGFRKIILWSLVLLFVHAGTLHAEGGHGKGNANKEPESIASSENHPENPSITKHSLSLRGETLVYSAEAGTLPIQMKQHDEKGMVFYVSYEAVDRPSKERPLTFAFNGGPGAASVWLHLGGIGPKRVTLNPDGKAPPPPASYSENPETWLAFTDLVFVDPIGTGFSRSISTEKKENEGFWGFEKDIESVAEFVRLYLTKKGRWLSPIYLLGESYGATRASGLSRYLQKKYGIELNGLILISPALDFNTISFTPSNDLPYLLSLPTYTAAAWYHKRLPDPLGRKNLAEVLVEVENFCLNRYPLLLSKGENLKEGERAALGRKLASFTGLSEAVVEKNHYRIGPVLFTKSLLEDEDRLLGRMDTSISIYNPNPAGCSVKYDPSLEMLYGPFSRIMNHYVRKELLFESDRAYEYLNGEVNRNWDWSSGLTRGQGFLDVSQTLRDAMTLNSHLRVLIASGRYDLATPYFAADYTVSHMWLGDLRSNIVTKYYRAGHMLYSHEEARKKLFEDAERFYVESAN